MTTLQFAPLTASLVIFTRHPRPSVIDESGDNTLAHLVSSFLDAAPITPVSRAVESGSRRWFQRVAAAQRGRVPLVLLDNWLLQALKKAAVLGDATTARWILDLLDDRLPRPLAFNIAAMIGDLALIECLISQGNDDEELLDAARHAAERGHLDILQCVVAAVYLPLMCNPCLLDSALRGGHRPCLEWLGSLKWIERSSAAITTQAVKRGDVDAVRYIFKEFPSVIDMYHPETQSALAKQPLILQMLLDEFNFTAEPFAFRSVVDNVCAFGPLDTVKLLLNSQQGGERIEVRHMFKESAARGGHVAVLEYLRQNEALDVWQRSSILADAVMSGRLEVVEWVLSTVRDAREQTLPDDAYYTATVRGHLAMLQWMFKRGATPDPVALLVNAARHGHIEMCEWLYARTDCNLVDLLIRVLSRRSPVVQERDIRDQRRPGSLVSVVYWMWDQIPNRERRVPSDQAKRIQLLQSAARHGCLRIVQEIHQWHPDINLSIALEEAAENGQLSVVRYLTQLGATVGPFGGSMLPEWMSACVCQSHLEVLMLIHAVDRERWTRDIVIDAIKAGRWFHPLSRPYAVHRWLVELLSCQPS